MRTVVRVVLAFLFGFVATYVIAVTAAFTYAHVNSVFDRDGGMSMGIVFLIGPAAGLIGGILAAIFIPIRLARRDEVRGDSAPARRGGARTAIAAIVCGIAGYLIGRFVHWMMAGMAFDSYAAALTVSLLPWLLALAGAGLAILALRRRPETA
jgi:hypothetical protein